MRTAADKITQRGVKKGLHTGAKIAFGAAAAVGVCALLLKSPLLIAVAAFVFAVGAFCNMFLKDGLAANIAYDLNEVKDKGLMGMFRSAAGPPDSIEAKAPGLKPRAVQTFEA